MRVARDSVVLYDTREQVYTTRATEPKLIESDGDETSVPKSGQKVGAPRSELLTRWQPPCILPKASGSQKN